MQKTRISIIFDQLFNTIFGFFTSSWKEKSINIISIFTGYFLFNNLITNYISKLNNKILIIPLIIIIFEIIIRLKPKSISKVYYFWLVFDKLRIGAIYALTLEAFKLGS
tara:strand:+ start:150 stop:476 length:327 start_codon:yes stop_codon:yes gene_type:complete